MTKQYIDRPPRIQPELPAGTIEIPGPPKTDKEQQPMWQALVPVISILGYILVSASGSGSNLTFLLPMALMVLVSTGVTVANAVRGWRQRRRAKEDYAKRLVDLRRDMVQSQNRQRSFYEYNYSPMEVVLAMRGDRRDNRSGTRLWERRTNDHDFGYIRLGIGTRESTVRYEVKEAQENDENEQMRDAERLQQDSLYVADVPITLPLYQRDVERTPKGENQRAEQPVRNIIGIAGTKQDAYEFIYALVAQFAAYHSPNDTNISILGLRGAAPNWVWAYPLPHASLYFEDMELILAPVSGVVTEVRVQKGDPLSANQVLATIRAADNSLVEVVAPYPGRVQAVLAHAEQEVDAGKLIIRMDNFKITDQQLEDLGKAPSLLNELGKKQKREIAGIPRFWKDRIWTELDRRARRLRDRDEKDQTDLTLPFMLTIVDLVTSRPDAPDDPLIDSWLAELESEAALSVLQGQGRQLGAAMFVLVPQRNKVPSSCQGVIELKRDVDNQLNFLYAEIGLSAPQTGRYVGVADKVPNAQIPRLSEFVEAMSRWQVRRSYGADIPPRVALLSLYDNAPNIDGLHVIEKWRDSKRSEKADWPKMPIGMLAGNEPRDLHFFADADGVHGMIAGATGSGKSELLMTLILSLAVKYDPSVVNFVLIDYKGGAAFDPFRTLPHVVDVVTNLRGNAVARMFAAINAELNRRQQINQDTRMKDIVRYREEGLHLSRRDYYPHLFIIIDEFAEMIANNNEYKAQLDSITRLGRALGVSLILAAQRPTGVTDQMRANIKMKLCLRVETKEESSEMLKMPDASYLPSIPGRGYLQIGNESLQLIQVGYSGQDYTAESGDYNSLERYLDSRFIWEEDLDDPEKEKTYEVLVRRMGRWALSEYGKDKDKRPWRKPWPNPLPDHLSLNTSDRIEINYLSGEDRDYIGAPVESFSLCPSINEWLEGERKDWERLDWNARAMRAVVGLIDDPGNARLRLLEVDFTQGHHVLLGAAGYGKSIFLRTVLTYLVTTHSPNDLNLYLLDFGRALDSFKTLPHMGAYILAHENERITRFMRFLDRTIEERKEILSTANVDSLPLYNISHPNNVIPGILVVIDNFAEFKDTYEQYLDNMAALLREGLGVGVYFLMTGEQTNNFQKLFALLPERLTLKLSDEGEYATVIGRGARLTEEFPGRGVRRIERTPLEFQVAVPLGLTENDPEGLTEQQKLARLVDTIVTSSKSKNYLKPTQIDPMPPHIGIEELFGEYKAQQPPVKGRWQNIILGRDDYDLSVKTVNMEVRKHFIVTGPPASGKTTALYAWILSLAYNYSPSEVGIVLVDYRRTLSEYGGASLLHDLPHVLGQEVISSLDQLRLLERHLTNEYESDEKGRSQGREIYVIIDNYDDMKYLAKGEQALLERFAEQARIYGKKGLHFIIAGLKEAMNSDPLINLAGRSQYGLAMSVDAAEGAPYYGSVPRIYSRMELPPGRGFVIVPGRVSVVQVAMPTEEEQKKLDAMDDLVASICALYPTEKAEWKPLPKDESEDTDPYANLQELRQDQRDCLLDLLVISRVGDDAPDYLVDSIRNSLKTFDDPTLLEQAKAANIDIRQCLNLEVAAQEESPAPASTHEEDSPAVVSVQQEENPAIVSAQDE